MGSPDDQSENNPAGSTEAPSALGPEGFDAEAARAKFLRGRGDKPESTPQSSFETQFQQGVRQYESLGGLINAVVVRPDNPKSDVPVVLAPGWSENRKVFKDSVEELYKAGRTVIALDHPRRGGTVEPIDGHPIDELRKAKAMQTIIEEDGIQQVDIIAHSEGAINGTIFAQLEPDKVRNMVLINPAGLIGKDTVPRLVGRFIRKGIQNLMHNITEKAARKAAVRGQVETYKYIGQNPRRAYKEVKAISHSEIEENLKELHDSGIGITVIAGVDDPGFPMDRLQKIVKSDAQPDGFVDGFLSVRGGHDELSIHPEQYTGAAEKMLTALENKQKGPQTI